MPAKQIELPGFTLRVWTVKDEPVCIAYKFHDDIATHAAVRVYYHAKAPTFANGTIVDGGRIILAHVCVEPVIVGHYVMCGTPSIKWDDLYAITVEPMIQVASHERIKPEDMGAVEG